MLQDFPKDIHSLHHFGRQSRPYHSRRRPIDGVARTLLKKATKSKPHYQNLDYAVGKSVKSPDHNVAEVTSVPTPIPQTDPRSTSVGTSSTEPTGTSNLISATKAELNTFTPLPPLLSAPEKVASQANAIPLYTLTVTSYVGAPSATAVTAQMTRTTSHALTSAIIALLAIGSTFLLVGIYVLVRACSRPRTRTHPTPSLPILKEDFPDQFGMDDSPVFGGKERFSSDNLNSTAWARFPQQDANITGPGQRPAEDQNKRQESRGIRLADSIDKAGGQQMALASATSQTLNDVQLQPAPSAVRRSISRLSIASMSIYPNSPMNPHDVGIAVDTPLLAAESHSVLKRTKSKSKLRDRYSLGTHDTNSWRYSQGLAYDLASPVPTSQSIPAIAFPSSGGRTRIKSSYYRSGVCPQNSGLTTLPSLQHTANPEANLESRRLRETKVLASALGLGSPSPPLPSPQPTIYPDDSLSRRPSIKPITSRPQRKLDTQPTASPSPSLEANVALGNLMLMGFTATSQTVSQLGYLKEPPTPSTSATSLAGLGKFKNVDDKPPRVPSPPPIPSLAQMALAHTNPSDYADYRSPTYSIYGMYQPERKSRVTSCG